ncbi:hypothetical protein ACIRU3_36895 [Streptomyces sp. NPDC101151]|uniref:hypothetical protein n=1 Tax=Streptomyces sp. NPDC101151 TaxID=3366115 RepID=UPI00381181F7
MQIGNGNLQINVSTVAYPAARSAYLYQVRAIAPEILTGREQELAELADFCTRSDAGAYQWWRAKAWAGKSALMSWFVLHPPPGTRIVSFFITARFASQSDREAFLDVVIEQLAALVGEPVPPTLTAATRPSHLWKLLDAAAAACEQQRQRLVLVVDGLDEDSGASDHSIAALLPARPEAGMRIVVAGRHDPPIPSDVPDGHPLRDPAVERVLRASPHAQVVRRDADRELKRLLRGTNEEQDLLGLITAAGGGLSGRDLAELTGRQAWEIEDVLHAVAGRTFTRRPAFGLSGLEAAGEAYVFGHEELQRTAVRFLGDGRMAEHRRRLHTWADQYRNTRWPTDTPGFLFRGYFRMLHAHGDLPRMIDCALDKARHDRMLDMSGGDTAALTEITTTQDEILDRDPPDLRAMTLLAVHRDHLVQRNKDIPPRLPAVWAFLGHPQRADTLARSIPDPGRRVKALVSLSGALAERSALRQGPDRGGELVLRAREAAYEAEAVARTVIGVHAQSEAWADVAEAMARAGEADRFQSLAGDAEATALAIPEPNLRVPALASLGAAMARAGEPARAEDLIRDAEAVARTITDPQVQRSASVKVVLAKAVTRAGNAGHVDGLARDAEAVARTITSPFLRAQALRTAAEVVARAGDAARAETMARTITGSFSQAGALRTVAEVVARAGDAARAETMARTITDPHEQALALTEVAAALARSGDVGRAEELVHEAEAVTRTTADPEMLGPVLAALAAALARAGDAERAEAVARTITDVDSRAEALKTVAEVVARAGDAARAEIMARTITDPHEQALALMEVAAALARADEADRAEALVRTIIGVHSRSGALAEVVGAVARAGDVDYAEAVARSFAGPGLRGLALARLAEVVARAGDVLRAEDLACEAEAAVRSNPDPYVRVLDMAVLAEALVRAGDMERAENLAHKAEARALAIPEPEQRVPAVLATAEVLARLGNVDRAEELAHEANTVARTIAAQEWRGETLAEVAETMAKLGDIDRAEAMARAIDVPEQHASALAKVARQAGTARSSRLIAQALRLGTWQTAADALAVVQPDVLTVVADDLLAPQPRALPPARGRDSSVAGHDQISADQHRHS